MAFMESFPPPVETITVAQAQSDSWAPTRLLSGTVRSPEHLVIATEIPGRVVELPFASGDTVPKGAAILVLFNDDLEAQRTALQADLNLVNTQLERNQTLEADALVSRPTGHSDRANIVPHSTNRRIRGTPEPHDSASPLHRHLGHLPSTCWRFNASQ